MYYDPSRPANDVPQMYSDAVQQAMLAEFKSWCEGVTEERPPTLREDGQPRTYGDTVDLTLLPGEAMIIFDSNKVLHDVLFVEPPQNYEPPAGGSCMRVKWGDTVDDASAAAERFKQACFELSKPPPGSSRKRRATEPAQPELLSDEERRAADAATVDRWYDACVREARRQSVSQPLHAGASHCCCACPTPTLTPVAPSSAPGPHG